MCIENLPDWLKEQGLFCFWRYEERPGTAKPAKVLYSPKTGKRLDITNLSDFGTFNDVSCYAARGYSGVGISITDEICAIDIDHCFVVNHPDIELIIIDTFQKIRGTARQKETLYAHDYREMGMVKKFADDHEISILVVHHNRKMGDESDSFNMISGTNGILGAADTSWVLTSGKRSDTQATLCVTGRDVEQAELTIEFNKSTCRWELIGSQAEMDERKAWAAYECNPLVKAVKRLLNESPQHRWSGQAKDLLDAMDDTAGWNPQKVGYGLRKLKDAFYKFDCIAYASKDANGTGGKLHEFVGLDATISQASQQC